KYKIVSTLNKLTDAQQYIIYLAFYEGLTRQEIAKKLKIPLSTVESKIKTSLINLNDNFTGKASLFNVKNETAELIYPFVLGSFDFEEEIKTFNKFKGTEPFPWKLLGDYQNLVSLLPVILELEFPTEKTNEKISNKIYHLKSIKEEKVTAFEPVSSTSSKILETVNKAENDAAVNETIDNNEIKISETTDEFSSSSVRKKDDYEPVIPLKPAVQENQLKRTRDYSTIIIVGLIILFIISTVVAYYFYNERITNYEKQIQNLSTRIQAIIEENRNKPEIPGLSGLRNPQTINLESRPGLTGSGEIIFSFNDKRGYLHIRNLPILKSDSAYQLWGNFKGDFISLV